MQLPAANQGTFPAVEDGLAVARFDDLILKTHEDWATPMDKFGKPDDGQRYHFKFTLVDAAGNPIPDPESEGDFIELEALTRTATGAKSNFAAMLKGVLTPVEFAAWEANQPLDGDKLQGRLLNVEVGHSEKGYPQIKQALGAYKVKAAK